MKQPWTRSEITFVRNCHKRGLSRFEIAKLFYEKFLYQRSPDSIRHCVETHAQDIELYIPKVLLVDVETKPKKSWHWGVWQQNLSHNMMIEDGALLSWSAKWIGESGISYKDQRGNEKSLMNDKNLLKPLVELLKSADIVIWQNGDGFDYGEINNRIAEHGLDVPDNYKTIDTKKVAKRHLRLPWYSLEYMTERFNKKYKKQDHKEFPGFALWDEVMKGNKKAWNCMRTYNEFDVLSMEELFVDTLAKFARGSKIVRDAMRAYEHAKKKK
jgi:DNA polymerase elongation subunit (family B)